ncbi:hypothetical protein BV25DRAFT_1910692 [Artomyces pyxidatus]|uniref:Uncharacterized protein n=1 Tax=Artomyces pyxidatus TaxID=48021 RepID=A0ACB8TKI9_9AGAM|nr:hypothetical protein BV25DRAFT_1910692 [Artomyces pyxidatus]
MSNTGVTTSSLTVIPTSISTSKNEGTIARTPFDDPGADIVIRSCDKTCFRVFMAVLRLASPIFADMLSIPQPVDASSGAGETYDGLPVVDVSEDARTLYYLLQWCYPMTSPTVTQMSDLRLLLLTSRKYAMDMFREDLQSHLRLAISSDPVGAYVAAVSNGLEDLATQAAVRSLQLSLTDFHSPELRHIPAEDYNVLVQYHVACGIAASDLTSKRFWFAPIPDILQTSPACNECFILDPRPSSVTWYAPRVLWAYLQRVGPTLMRQPDGDAILTNEFLPDLHGQGRCPGCGKDRTLPLNDFGKLLSTAVGLAVEKVPKPVLKF